MRFYIFRKHLIGLRIKIQCTKKESEALADVLIGSNWKACIYFYKTYILWHIVFRVLIMPLLIHILTKFQMPKMLLASELGRDEDDHCLMAIKMNEKFDKYYEIENLNPIFFFLASVVLDPHNTFNLLLFFRFNTNLLSDLIN